MSVVLACDLGGTSFRAALVDATGESVARCARPAPELREEGGASETPAARWWDRLVEAAGELARSAPGDFARVVAISICGVTRTQVLLDAAGAEIRPALTWKDVRAEATATRLKARLAGHPEAEGINAFHPLARLAWLAEAEPDAAAALASVLDPKDYLNFRLTGRRASDAISMARLAACAAMSGGVDPFAAAGAPRGVLPALLAPHAPVGAVLPALPAPLDRLAGVPVMCCAADTWAAVAGLGALRPGRAYNISGTTEVFGVVSETAAQAPGLLTVDWGGLWQLGGPGQNGADTLAWLLALLGEGAAPGSVGATMAALLAGPRDPQPLLFLPYLQGERTPYWNVALRGAFVGLNRRHGATDLAYAVLEGVGFLNRIVLERAEAALGTRVTAIRFGGGASANDAWSQIKADICGRPVLVCDAAEPGLLGAAMVGWTGLGRFPSLDAAQERLARVARRFEPRPGRRSFYDALFGLFRQAEAALAPVSCDLSSLTRDGERP